jgi:hypothetical protein
MSKEVQMRMRTAEQPEVRKAESDERKLTFVASDGSRDTAGTVLNVNGWDLERFNRNGIIGYQHKVYGGYDDTENPDNVIGKGHAYVEGGKLMVDVEFEPAEINPLAEKIYQKLLFGSLKAVSVGFLPIGRGSWGKGEESLEGNNPTYYYAGQELLEVSVVNIPANPNALRKGLEGIEDELEQLKKEAEEVIPEPVPEEVEETAEPEEPRGAEVNTLAIERELLIARASLHNQ